MPLRKFKVRQQKVIMIRKQRLAKLIQFYQERSIQAVRRGETYMQSPSLESLTRMVAYRYPRLGKNTKRSYAKELLATLQKDSEKISKTSIH